MCLWINQRTKLAFFDSKLWVYQSSHELPTPGFWMISMSAELRLKPQFLTRWTPNLYGVIRWASGPTEDFQPTAIASVDLPEFGNPPITMILLAQLSHGIFNLGNGNGSLSGSVSLVVRIGSTPAAVWEKSVGIVEENSGEAIWTLTCRSLKVAWDTIGVPWFSKVSWAVAGTKLVALVLDYDGSGSPFPEGRDCLAFVAVAVFAFVSSIATSWSAGSLSPIRVSVSFFPATSPEAERPPETLFGLGL